uniref:NADH dehydrogenase [ubiquinone] 1 beta subcomplex subunit 7 n=1 Tax=Oncorhynchus kisutch TaxID=8019 RepID=A0A8C7JCB2_ONCKI
KGIKVYKRFLKSLHYRCWTITYAYTVTMFGYSQRDYCAHHLIKLMKCKRDNWPNFLACKHERHDWDYCEHQEEFVRSECIGTTQINLTRRDRLN